jgi:hypothetical protein
MKYQAHQLEKLNDRELDAIVDEVIYGKTYPFWAVQLDSEENWRTFPTPEQAQAFLVEQSHPATAERAKPVRIDQRDNWNSLIRITHLLYRMRQDGFTWIMSCDGPMDPFGRGFDDPQTVVQFFREDRSIPVGEAGALMPERAAMIAAILAAQAA